MAHPILFTIGMSMMVVSLTMAGYVAWGMTSGYRYKLRIKQLNKTVNGD